MTDILFREARIDELPAIVALLADDVLGRAREAPGVADAAYRAGFDAISADPNQLLAVAVEGETVIGTMLLRFLPNISDQGAWRGQIEAVQVAHQRRRTGIGERFVAWAIDRCRARGCARVQLTSNRARLDAHRFYDRLGFEASSIGFKLKL
jgi:GNAT superfamily N-acetyltransferase